MAGLGSFLRHTTESNFGGGGKWLKKWKDDKRIVLWLHTLVEPQACWSHSFQMLDVVEDKDNGGKPKRIMRYPRFVSPDAENVHRNQRFRGPDDRLQVLPDRDAFLLLREWLRRAEHIAHDEVIFKWTDPKDGRVVAWNRGELSGLVKRGQQNAYHTLDTKLEYIFVIAQNDDPGAGSLLTRESTLIGQGVADVIKQQQQFLGEEGGDPLLHPYAFCWEFNPKARSPKDFYKAFKAEGVELTDEIWAQISSEDFPDPTEHTVPKDGDQEKIREAMTAAAQVELPLDEIFSEDPAVRVAVATGEAGRAAKSAARPAAAPRPRPDAAKPPPAKPGAPPAAQRQAAPPARPRPGAPAPSQSRPVAAAPAAPAAGQPRRKKVSAPPPPAPAEELIACDDCGFMMKPTDSKCPKCGAEYDVGDAAAPAQAAAAPEAAPAAGNGVDSCFSCGGLVKDGVCTECGLEQGDDMPF